MASALASAPRTASTSRLPLRPRNRLWMRSTAFSIGLMPMLAKLWPSCAASHSCLAPSKSAGLVHSHAPVLLL